MVNDHAPGERSVLSPGAFLVRGLLVGLAAGVVAFLVAFAFGEPYVDRAIELEEAASASGEAHAAGHTGTHDHAHSHGGEEEPATEVPRGTQRTWGLLTGLLAIGVALGGLAALAAAFAVGRLGTLTARQATSVVCAVGFVAVALVPFLKHPATPPGVGSGDTIGPRTASYFAFLLVSVVAAVVAVWVATRLGRRVGGFEAAVAAGASYVVLVVAVGLLLPPADGVGSFPADTLWGFRVASLATLATLWMVLGVGLVATVGRLHDRAVAAAERRALAASL